MSKTINDKLCALAMHRAEVMGYKGKRRDDFVLDYISGAVSAMYLTGATLDAGHLGIVAQMIIAPRGHREVASMAKDNEEPLDVMYNRFNVEYVAARAAEGDKAEV